ncbi:hypothetical protein POX_a00771 [Penicillium oxalicum]|uniref:hypothetical protein n=1 Tax=Penicillium oxalicum TaxID=69781 RepID=UPI0020B8DB6D|nr:hypothetical protein POX_a00771 [Penicillium oxalicum]KAI2794181.1 hypothetical protein POX_a00771 [Penicillium oxalicum]
MFPELKHSGPPGPMRASLAMRLRLAGHWQMTIATSYRNVETKTTGGNSERPKMFVFSVIIAPAASREPHQDTLFGPETPSDREYRIAHTSDASQSRVVVQGLYTTKGVGGCERVVGLCDAYRFETVQNGLSLQERVQSEAEKGAPDRKQVPRLYFCCHSEAVMYLPVDNWTSRR